MKRKILIVAAAVAGALAAGVLGAEAWLRHTIGHAVENALDGTGATVSLGRVGVSLPLRQISVRDLHIVAQNNDTAHRGFTVVSLDLSVPRITFGGVSYRRVGEKREPAAGRVAVEGVRATLVTLDGDATTRWELGGGNLSARSLTLDSLPGAMKFAADSIVCHTAGGAQLLRIDSVAMDTAAGTLVVKGLALAPQWPKEQFAGRAKKDWTRVALGAVSCTGVDYGRLFAARTFAIDSVVLASADIASYKDRNVHRQPHAKAMLYQTIQRLPLPLEIENLGFDDLDVTYEELADRAASPGVVTLSSARGTARNLTNIAAGHDRFMTVDIASATFMHSGALEARFLFPVDSLDDHWELTGRLGPTDMTALNRALEPLAGIKITSGAIRSCDFHIAGTLARSGSWLKLEYNDLKVEILDRHDHSRTRRFLTVVADRVLIRPDNPGRNRRLREAEGEHERDPERSMWNYIWHSLFPAIRKTII